MARKFIAPDKLRALIAQAMAEDPRCEGLGAVTLLQVDEPGAQNWTVSVPIGSADDEAGRALGGILARLGTEYDVAWKSLH